MAGGSRDDVFSLYPEVLHIPVGVTIVVSPIAGQLGCILKTISGGSLSILRNPEYSDGASTVGSSYAVASYYQLGASEILNVSQAGTLYLLAAGATCVANLLRLRSQGT